VFGDGGLDRIGTPDLSARTSSIGTMYPGAWREWCSSRPSSRFRTSRLSPSEPVQDSASCSDRVLAPYSFSTSPWRDRQTIRAKRNHVLRFRSRQLGPPIHALPPRMKESMLSV
jgi:hypothetical protein